MTPCGPSPAPPAPDTSLTPAQGLAWVPPRVEQAREDGSRAENLPKRDPVTPKRLVKPEKAQIPSICKFRFFYPAVSQHTQFCEIKCYVLFLMLCVWY